MKYVKMFGLVALAAAALMAWVGAGSASATTVDCTGLNPCPTNEIIHAIVEPPGVILHPPIGDIECGKGTVEGKLEVASSSTETPGGLNSALTFGECNATVTVLANGKLEIHNIFGTNDGTLTSSGSEVTVEFIGFHCIFKTNATDIGRLTGASNNTGNATLDIEAKIPRTGGRSGAFCGSEAEWTGSYIVDKPLGLKVTP